MSAYPLIMHGEYIDALVVGGGRVAARKIDALLAAGARVRVVAPGICEDIARMRDTGSVLVLEREYETGDIRNANLIFAATDSRDVNAAITRDARLAGRLVNVADVSVSGDFSTAATHRSGSLVIAVFAGGVPTAAARIRNAIAAFIGNRIGTAVEQLAELRERTLRRGDRESWRSIQADVLGDDFVSSVASGEFEKRLERWR